MVQFRGAASRIAYVSNAALPGRAPSLAFSAHAARGFVDAGADVSLVLRRVTRVPAKEALLRATDVEVPGVIGLRAPRLGGSLRLFYRRAASHLAASDRDFVLFRDINFIPWAVRLRTDNRKVFFESHGYWEGDGRKAGLARRWLAALDGVFCTSAPQVDLYRNAFPDLAVELALTGTRAPEPNERAKFSRTLGYLGSLGGPYPVETVIEGLARSDTDGVRLLVVGARSDAEREKLRRHAADLGIEDRVEVHGWVSPAELVGFRRRIDVGVVPLSSAFKTRTNTPLKLLDYLSAALPTIATRADVVTEYVTDGRETLLVDDSAASWAEAIDRVYADFGAYQRMATAARSRAGEVTWKRRAERMLEAMVGRPA